MKSKFDMIFESVMRNIITEAWDRFYINNIIEVTRIVTSNFTTWEKGSSGSKILKELMTHRHMKGNEEVLGKGTRDTTLNWSLENPWMREDGFDRIFDMCRSYWFGRKKSGRSFDTQCARFFEKYEEGDTLVAADIGVFAYALYAAMNSMQKKQERNEQEMNNINVDDTFKEGSKITITLTISDGKSTSYNGYNSTAHIIGTSADYPGMKFDISSSAAMKKQRLTDFPNCPPSRLDRDSKFFSIFSSDVINNWHHSLTVDDVATFSGVVQKVDKRFKTVYISRAKIDRVDSFVDVKAVMEKKKAEEADANIKKAKDAIIAGTSQFDSMTEEERQEVRSKVKNPQSLFDIFLTDKTPSMLVGIYSFFTMFSASPNKNLLITLYDLRDMLTTDPVTPENKAKVMAILDKYYTK